MSMHHMPARTGAGSQGLNFDNQRGRNIRWWLSAIKRDRNYARIVIGLPLTAPVSPEVRRTAEAVQHPF